MSVAVCLLLCDVVCRNNALFYVLVSVALFLKVLKDQECEIHDHR